MATVLTFNETLGSIVDELEKMSPIEQKQILAFIKAKRIKKEPRISFINPEKGLKPLTMAQIDKIKHDSRKTHAGK
jgi:hypothetical protein